MCSIKQQFVESFFLQTANVLDMQRKIQLSGLSAYPDGSSFQLIPVSGILLYSLAVRNLSIQHTAEPFVRS